jgi:hypothetical protein
MDYYVELSLNLPYMAPSKLHSIKLAPLVSNSWLRPCADGFEEGRLRLATEWFRARPLPRVNVSRAKPQILLFSSGGTRRV